MITKQPHHVDVHVGGRVKQRRLLRGLSQEQLGTSLGLTFQQVQKYEKGTNRISSSRLWEIATILGVPISFFYEGLKEKANAAGFAEQSQDPFVSAASSTEGLKLNRYFIQITDAQVRHKVLELVKTLAKASQSATEKK
ncbi:MAG: transcriptional regulator [Hyphomicrobiales bacterium]|nr:MAG: transcriptional regulator [Hyphomicrobiales bacterium]